MPKNINTSDHLTSNEKIHNYRALHTVTAERRWYYTPSLSWWTLFARRAQRQGCMVCCLLQSRRFVQALKVTGYCRHHGRTILTLNNTQPLKGTHTRFVCTLVRYIQHHKIELLNNSTIYNHHSWLWIDKKANTNKIKLHYFVLYTIPSVTMTTQYGTKMKLETW